MIRLGFLAVILVLLAACSTNNLYNGTEEKNPLPESSVILIQSHRTECVQELKQFDSDMVNYRQTVFQVFSDEKIDEHRADLAARCLSCPQEKAIAK